MDYPIVLDAEGKYEAILNGAYNIVVEDELLSTSNGYETLTFNISNYDKKRKFLINEKVIQVQGRRYIVRLIEDLKNNSNICTVTCDASWYDLNDGELKYLMHYTEAKIDALTAINQQLEGTDWTVGTVNVTGTKNRRNSKNQETSLYNLRQIKGIFEGDLYFDTLNSKVSLLSDMGVRHQKIFCYEKNTTSIKRTIDTRNLFTRFTLIGRDSEGNDVTIASINGGKDYVENYEWFDKMGLPRKIKWYKKTDDRYSNLENMKAYMESWLSVYSQPVIGYELSVSMFELAPNLGDYVYIYDKDLGIGEWLRIVSRKKNVLEPWRSTVELEATKKTIIETIVSNTTTSKAVQDSFPDSADDIDGDWGDSQMGLPSGVENWVMQFKNGQWKAVDVVGDINKVLDEINGEVL